MGGKSGGGGGTDWNQVAYTNAYNAAQGGQPWDIISQNTDQNYLPAAQAGFDAFHASRMGPMFPSFPSFEPPEMPEYDGPSYEEQMAEQQRMQGIAERDNLYTGYMDAASSAADYVNSEISREMANAKLLGIDYNITDEMKSQRINDYFSTLWGEGEQTRLEALMSEYGDPEGFKGFTVKRGDGSKYAGTPGEEKTITTTAEGKKPRTLATEDEDESLSPAAILG